MTKRTELSIGYNEGMKPISGHCTRCGEMVPTPPKDLESPGEIVAWLSEKFLEHKKSKHPHSEKEETE